MRGKKQVDLTVSLIGGEQPVFSARKLSESLNLSYVVVKNAIETGYFKPQAKIQDDPEARPAYGFAIAYVEELRKILGSSRTSGKRILSEKVKTALKELNKKWDHTQSFDEEADLERTKLLNDLDTIKKKLEESLIKKK